MLVGITKIPESTWETLAGEHKMNKIRDGGLVFFLDEGRAAGSAAQRSEDLIQAGWSSTWLHPLPVYMQALMATS